MNSSSNPSLEVLREREVKLLADAFLQRKTWCAVLAPPLAGRSTLARQVQVEFSRRFLDTHVILVSLQPANTLGHLWQQIRTQLNPLANIPVRSEEGEQILLAEEMFESLHTTLKPVCLIIDNLDDQPFEILRLMAHELRRFANDDAFARQRERLQLILLGGLQVHYLVTGSTSPLFTILKIVQLEDLDPKLAEQLLLKYIPHIRQLNEECRTELFTLTNGHPYLVRQLGQLLRDHFEALDPEVDAGLLRRRARQWESEADAECFRRILEFLQRYPSTFREMMTMLDGAEIQSNETEHTMSGAVCLRNGLLHFRGTMISDALEKFFTPIRRSDFSAFHGDWPTARAIYSTIPASQIREHRRRGAFPGVVDLMPSISANSLQTPGMLEANNLITQAGRFFLGADEVLLWRYTATQQTPTVIDAYPIFRFDAEISEVKRSLVRSAIQKAETFTLDRNRGLVVALSDTGTRSGWALELRYQSGLPNDVWFKNALRSFESLAFMSLELARQRDADLERQNQQRHWVHEIAIQLLSAKDVAQTLQMIVDGVRDKLKYQCAQVCLVFPELNELRSVKTNGSFASIQNDTVRRLDSPDPLAVVVRERTSKIVGDTRDDNEKCDQAAAEKSDIRSFVAVPLLGRRDDVIGVLQVGSSMARSFKPSDAVLLQLLADDAAVAVSIAREHQHLNQAIQASGTAMASIDAAGNIEYCNREYEEFFDVKPGMRTHLASEGNEDKFLVRLAFERETKTIATVRSKQDRSYLVTVVGIGDAFGRFDGGIEVIGTRNPVMGLSESLREMFTLTKRPDLENAIVRCLVQNLGYSRARFYAAHGNHRLVSSCSMGMSNDSSHWFGAGKGTLNRNRDDRNGDGFECLRADRPVIFVAADRANAQTPNEHIQTDDKNRPVLSVKIETLPYLQELEKDDVAEWVDVGLGTVHHPLGKLSVDLKGSVRTLGIEDVEILALFGRWATDALARISQLERIENQARFAKDARFASDQRGLEATVLDFLLNITHKGGPEFNRAVVFLKHPHSGLLQGFLSHGAPDQDTWQKQVDSIHSNDRHEFLADARRRMMEERNSDETSRLAALNQLIIREMDPQSVLSFAVQQRSLLQVPNASTSADLQELFTALRWESAEECLLCPLIYDNECEGLVYVDRSFTPEPFSDDDRSGLETYCQNLALTARPLRMSEQLRSRVLGVTHTTISPAAAIRGLAEGLRASLPEREQQGILDMIVAESQRSADLFRRLLRVSAGTDHGLRLQPEVRDIVAVVQDRTRPYCVLMKADEIQVSVDLPKSHQCTIDADLMGDVFAELATNAMVNLQRDPDPDRKFQIIGRRMGDQFILRFQNSGPTIPLEIQDRIWERFVSQGGGTGIGLSLVKEIVMLHEGKIGYSVTADGLSEFRITIYDK